MPYFPPVTSGGSGGSGSAGTSYRTLAHASMIGVITDTGANGLYPHTSSNVSIDNNQNAHVVMFSIDAGSKIVLSARCITQHATPAATVTFSLCRVTDYSTYVSLAAPTISIPINVSSIKTAYEQYAEGTAVAAGFYLVSLQYSTTPQNAPVLYEYTVSCEV